MGKQKSGGNKPQQQMANAQPKRTAQTATAATGASKSAAKSASKGGSKAAASTSAPSAAAADPAAPQYRVEYKGWAPKPDSGARIDEVDYASLTPAKFYVEYVAKRKPVLLRRFAQSATPGVASEFEALARDWTSPSFLRSQAGDAAVRIEYKQRGSGGSFGRGLHRWMPFKSFLKLLGAGSGAAAQGTAPVADDDAEAVLLKQHALHALYLTSQPIDSAPDGAPLSLCAEPLSSLLGPMPLRPSLFEPLVPVQYNVWMGAYEDAATGAAAAASSSSAAAAAAAASPAPRSSPFYRSAGTTSGLHHDFHDNAYLLLAGRKTFHLFPPSLAPCLYTHGMKPRPKGATQPRCTVAPNGVIEYEAPEDEDEEGAGSDDDESMSGEALSAAQERLARQMEADLAEESDEDAGEGMDDEGEEEEEAEGEDEDAEGSEDGAEQDEDSDDEAVAAAAAAAAADEEARQLAQSKRTAISSQLAELRQTHSSLELNLRVSIGAGSASPAEVKRRKNLSTEAGNVSRKIAALEARLSKVEADETQRVADAQKRLEREAEEARERAAARAGKGGDEEAEDEEENEEDDDSDEDDGDIDLANLRDDYVDEGDDDDADEGSDSALPASKRLPRGCSLGMSDEDDEEEDDEDEEIDPAEKEAWVRFMAAAEEAQKRKKEKRGAKGQAKGKEEAAAAADSGSRKRKEPASSATAAAAADAAASSKKAKTASAATPAAAAASVPALSLTPSSGEHFPSNFSRLDFATLPVSQIQKQFPSYNAARGCVPLVVEVARGDMLYLPASWFHEVFSAGASEAAPADATASAAADADSFPPSVHMALNYWFAPPSNEGSYARPYDSDDAHHVKRWKAKYAPQAEALKRTAREKQDRTKKQMQAQQQQRKDAQPKAAAKVALKPAASSAASSSGSNKANAAAAAPVPAAAAAAGSSSGEAKPKLKQRK